EGAAGGAADTHPRRRDVVGRRSDRGADQGRPPRGDEGADDVHRRPPPLHHLPGRRDRGDGPRPDRRPGDARGAARALPAVRGDRREGARGLGLPPTGSRGAGGAGEAVNETNGAQDFLALFRSIWRLIRGEDNRGRKVRWLLTLLRPYRRQVL